MSDIFLMAILPGCSGDRLLGYWFEVDRFDLDQPRVDLPVADALSREKRFFAASIARSGVRAARITIER